MVLVFSLVVLMGCTNNGQNPDTMGSETASDVNDMAVEEQRGDEDGEIFLGNKANEQESPSSDRADERQTAEKYIQTYYYETETLTFTEALTQLSNRVSQYNGYFESTSITGSPLMEEGARRRTADYKIRIPVENIDLFREEIEQGDLLYIRESRSEKENVTNQYVDLSARLKTLQLQEERLLSILEDANELEYILQLEQELSDVRYDIEHYTSSMRQLDNKIQYVTIHMTIREVYEVTPSEEEPRTFIERLNTGFGESLDQVKSFFVNMVLWLMTRSPILVTYAIILSILGVFVLKIVRRIQKKRKDGHKE